MGGPESSNSFCYTLPANFERVATQVPFSSQRKMMMTVHDFSKSRKRLAIQGLPETVAPGLRGVSGAHGRSNQRAGFERGPHADPFQQLSGTIQAPQDRRANPTVPEGVVSFHEGVRALSAAFRQ